MVSSSRYRLVFVLAFALAGVAAAQYGQTQPRDTVAPLRITQGPLIQYADEELSVVTWATDIAGDTRVYYGTDSNNLSRVAESNGYGTTHRVNLTRLSPNTTYYFQI